MTVYIPVGMFIFLFAVMVVLMFIAFKTNGIVSIFTSLICIMLAFINSKIVINGTLIQNISDLDGSGNIIQGVTTIHIPPLSYIFIFIGIFMVVILAIQVLREIKFRETKDVIELDL